MEIPDSLLQLFDDWEDDLTGSHLVENRTVFRRRNYEVVKNILAILLLHPIGSHIDTWTLSLNPYAAPMDIEQPLPPP